MALKSILQKKISRRFAPSALTGLSRTRKVNNFWFFQALNYMARGMGLPPLPPHGHPLAGHPGVNGAPHLAGPHHVLTSSASGVIGRPTSTPSTGTNAFNGKLYFLLLSKFEAITHARGQKVYFPSIIGGLLDLLLLSMSTCRIFTIQKFLCVFPILITILLWSFLIAKSWVRCLS